MQPPLLLLPGPCGAEAEGGRCERWASARVREHQGTGNASCASGDRETEAKFLLPAKPLSRDWLARTAWSGKGTAYKPFHFVFWFFSSCSICPGHFEFSLFKSLNILKFNFLFKSLPVLLQKQIVGQRLGRPASNLWLLESCQKYQEISSPMVHGI